MFWFLVIYLISNKRANSTVIMVFISHNSTKSIAPGSFEDSSVYLDLHSKKDSDKLYAERTQLSRP